MKLTRLISLLLVVIMLASLIVSCGEAENTPKETTPQTQGETVPETEPETEDPLHVDPVNLNGFTLRIRYPSEEASTWHVLNANSFTPEQDGEVVNNAVYDRNQRIQQDFNCKIEATQGEIINYWEETPLLQREILSGDPSFDILLGHFGDGPSMSLEGCFLDLSTLDSLDLDNPWWPKQMVNELTLDGQIYFLSDQIGLGAIKSAKVHYLNLKLFEDNDIPLPYDEVLSGKWTIDKLIALTKDFYVSAGTDNKFDDIYGYVTQPEQNGFLISCVTPVWQKNDIDILKIDLTGEKLNRLIEKCYDWYFETNGVLITDGTNPDTGDEQNIWCAKTFADGHALVGFGHVQTASTLFRDKENLDYGLIPFPKWDESQENYYSFVAGDLICVPFNLADERKEAVGTLLDVLACETLKTVQPAYLNDAMKGKYLNDEESKQVLDIVSNSLTISFASAYNGGVGLAHLFGPLFKGGHPTKDLASYAAKNMKKAQKRIDKIVEFYSTHEH